MIAISFTRALSCLRCPLLSGYVLDGSQGSLGWDHMSRGRGSRRELESEIAALWDRVSGQVATYIVAMVATYIVAMVAIHRFIATLYHSLRCPRT